jgi:predicted enzyme related to lactoylglutathione lyase
MAKSIELLVYPVKDKEKAKIFYNEFLDTEPYVDSDYYVGYKTDKIEIGLDPNSETGPIAYIDVENIDDSLQKMIKAGGEIVQDVKEVGGGLLIAQTRDSDGNVVGMRQETKFL